MRWLFLLFACSCALLLNAQPFRPALQHYPPGVYQGSNQNWQVLQDEKGRIYSANSNGVFVYDGKSWQKYTINNEGTVRSLYWDSSSARLYVGGIGEFGYFKADNRGKFMYYCLSDSLPKIVKENFLDVWKIWYLNDKFYFQTEQAIFSYNYVNGKFTWQTPQAGNFQYSFTVDNILFVQENERGLCYLTPEETISGLRGGSFFNTTGFFGNKSVSGIYKQADSSYLVITYKEGWYQWRPFSANKETLPVKIKTGADNIMATEQVYNSVQIVLDKDTTYLLGLFRGGVLKMNAKGELLERLSRANGLPDNEIYCLYPDKQGNVWIGVGGGLVRAQWLNPNWQLCSAEPSNGIEGDISSIVYYKNRLYISTSLGIFAWDSSMSRFESLSNTENVGQCWKLVITENGLLAGTNDGVYEVLPKKVVKITQKAQFVYNITTSKTIKGLYWLSTSDNLSRLYWNQKKWEEYPVNDSSLKDLISAVEDKAGVLWVTTGLKGIYRLIFASGQWSNKPVKITLIDTARGLPKMGGNQVYNTSLGIRIANAKGWYVYDSIKEHIILEDNNKKEVELYYRDSISDWLIFKDKRIIRDMSGRVDSISYHRIPKTNILLDIFTSDNGVIWLTSDKTIFRYEPKTTISFAASFPTQITQVQIGKDSVWFSGMGNNTDLNMGMLAYAYNNIQIIYSMPDFHDEKRISYQYRLLNNNPDTSWSALTTDTKKEYTNLSEGNYIFEVQGQNLYGAWGTVARVRFRILAPWYRSWWAYLLYVLLGISVTGLAIRLNSRRLRAANLLLEQRIAAATKQLQAQKDEIEQKNNSLEAVNREISNANEALNQAYEELNITLEMISSQKEEIQIQRDTLQHQHQQITDSIEAAQLIQQAMLPFTDRMNNAFDAHFVLYKPRDVVSGDFYWFTDLSIDMQNLQPAPYITDLKIHLEADQPIHMQLLAVADCTGHGVPGAFMSMLGVSLLEEIVMARRIFRPDWVLNELHKGVRHALKQEQTGNLFGMDIQIISLYYLLGNNRPFYIQFSGANNPLYYIHNNTLTEIKADKQAVGGSLHRNEKARIFSLHGFAVPTERLMLYLFSDGYADQFGGPNKRKYMTKNFQQLLLHIHQLPVAEQQQQLDEIIINWINEGKTKQMDDITVLGIQI